MRTHPSLLPALVAAVVLSLGNVLWADVDGQVLQTDPRSYWHYLNGLFAQRTGDVDRSLVEFQQAIRYNPKSAAIHDRLAYHYYVEGLEYKSVEELRNSIEIDPQKTEPRMMLAGLLGSQGEYGKAQHEYEEVLRIDPKNVEARYYLAGVLAGQNRYDDAIQQYLKILDQNPKEGTVYYNMGLIYTRSNQVAKAEEAFKKAIEYDPKNAAAYSSLGLVYELDQKPQEAITIYQSLVEKDPENPQPYLAMGELYYNQKEDEKALEAFRHYSSLKPSDVGVNDYIGLCYFRLKRYAEAVEVFQKLLDQKPTESLIRYRLSAAFEELEDFDSAEKQLLAILANDDKSLDAWVRLALLYDRQKKSDLAQKTVQDGLKVVPDHPELLLVQGMLFHEADKFAEALEQYQKVARIELTYQHRQAPEYNLGTLAQAYFNQGVVLDKQGKFDDAIASMKKVIDVQPDNADAYNYIGYSFADKGIQLDDAKRYMENALKLDPENPYYLDSMGWVHFKRGEYALAQASLEKAVENLKTSQKDDAVIFDHLAQVFLKQGQKQQAVAQWKKASALDPANKDFSEKIQANSAPGL